jgi:hypothetical protein
VPNWRSLIDKDFLGAWDLVGPDGKPRDFTLEIASVRSELLKTKETPKGKRKAVIRFKGARKAMVANSTNCEVIEGLYSADFTQWVGRSVTLYQTDVRSPTGGTIKGIRVRPKKPGGPAEVIEDRPVDPEIRAAQDEAFQRGDAHEGP